MNSETLKKAKELDASISKMDEYMNLLKKISINVDSKGLISVYVKSEEIFVPGDLVKQMLQNFENRLFAESELAKIELDKL